MFISQTLVQCNLLYSESREHMMDPEAQSNLRYELRINDMVLIHSEKQTLIDCIATLLGLESAKLHEIICVNLVKCLDQYNLPRKLSYIRKDNSIIDDYKKYPELVNFMKITLEMVSQIFETKITMFYLNNQGLLTGLIINEKGFQPEIKIGRINNYFFEVRECLSSNSHHSTQQDPSTSSHSYKFYEAFDLQPLPKKIQPKKLQNLLVKSYSHLPTSSLIKKNISLCEQRPFTNPLLPEQQLQKSVQIPAILNSVPVIKNFDELSLENGVDEQEQIVNDKLTESIKFSIPQQINLTQSLTITKGPLQPPTLQPITLHEQPTTPTPIPNTNAQQPPSPQLSDPNNLYYGYYSQHLNQQGHQMMYYPPYMLNGNTTTGRGENYGSGFGNVSTASMSPGKNIAAIRRQNSTLEINENQRYTGRLKFFDEGKNYGFIIMDADESDIFVHCDDLQKAGINKERVRTYKQSEGILRFSFKVMSYFGKYRQSRKAVDLIILDDGLGMPSLYT